MEDDSVAVLGLDIPCTVCSSASQTVPKEIVELALT
jgi:hypothetical protein